MILLPVKITHSLKPQKTKRKPLYDESNKPNMKKSAGKKVILTEVEKQDIFNHFDAAILSLNKLHLKLEILCKEQRAAAEMKTSETKR